MRAVPEQASSRYPAPQPQCHRRLVAVAEIDLPEQAHRFAGIDRQEALTAGQCDRSLQSPRALAAGLCSRAPLNSSSGAAGLCGPMRPSPASASQEEDNAIREIWKALETLAAPHRMEELPRAMQSVCVFARGVQSQDAAEFTSSHRETLEVIRSELRGLVSSWRVGAAAAATQVRAADPSSSSGYAASLLEGDPWLDCEDIAKEDLIESLVDGMAAARARLHPPASPSKATRLVEDGSFWSCRSSASQGSESTRVSGGSSSWRASRDSFLSVCTPKSSTSSPSAGPAGAWASAMATCSQATDDDATPQSAQGGSPAGGGAPKGFRSTLPRAPTSEDSKDFRRQFLAACVSPTKGPPKARDHM